MLARNDPWSDLANAVASGKILPWSKSMLNKLETACIQGHYSGEEWRELLHSKLIQLASTFGFKHYFTDGVLQIGSNFIRIDFNLHTLKCFVAYAGEDFSECLKTGQYLLNQKWNEIQKSLTMILTLFSPSQSQDKLQTKYNQLKECERRMMMLFNGSKRKGIYFMEVPIFEDFTAIITPTPQNNNNCLMIHLSEPLYINILSLELISCSLVDPTFQNSVQLNKTELTKLQLITKQKSNIQCAHAIQFDQAQDMKRIIEVLWVWKRISLLIKGWKMNNTTFLYINKNGVIQSSSNGCSVEINLNNSFKDGAKFTTFPAGILDQHKSENVITCIKAHNINSFEVVFASATTDYQKKKQRSRDGSLTNYPNETKPTPEIRNDDQPAKHPHLMDILKNANVMKGKLEDENSHRLKDNGKRSALTDKRGPPPKISK